MSSTVSFALSCLIPMLLACTNRDMNVPPLLEYAEKLASTAGASLGAPHCEMFEGSRKGFCIFKGSAKEIGAFTHGIKLTSTLPAPAYGSQSCLVNGDFGRPEGSSHVAKPGTERFTATAPLPPNTHNVKFDLAYTNATAICLELSYPYG